MCLVEATGGRTSPRLRQATDPMIGTQDAAESGSANQWRAPDQDHRLVKLHYDESGRLLLSAQRHSYQVHRQFGIRPVIRWQLGDPHAVSDEMFRGYW
jgi:hypothetical protein